MIDFDRRRSILGGINRGRKKKSEKKREKLKIRRCYLDPDPSPARTSRRGFAGIFLLLAWASRGED
ncbi:hypothetical protein BHM03_00054669, partial [Ensete ventricosum]